MITKHIGIIGCGNMGEAIFRGLSRNMEKSTMLMVSEANEKRRLEVQSKYKIIPAVDNNYLVKNSDVIILAMKPQDLEGVVRNEVAIGASPSKLIISIAAGISTRFIENILGSDVPVIRVMPNLAATVGESVSSISRGSAVTNKDMDTAKEILSTIGDVVEVDEALVDAVTAVSGSGPAYFFHLMESLIDAAVELGIDRKIAAKIVLKTALGSARLAEAMGGEPEELRRKVTSKGGTTEAAFKIIDERKIKEALKDAVKRGHKRSQELSKG